MEPWDPAKARGATNRCHYCHAENTSKMIVRRRKSLQMPGHLSIYLYVIGKKEGY